MQALCFYFGFFFGWLLRAAGLVVFASLSLVVGWIVGAALLLLLPFLGALYVGRELVKPWRNLGAMLFGGRGRG